MKTVTLDVDKIKVGDTLEFEDCILETKNNRRLILDGGMDLLPHFGSLVTDPGWRTNGLNLKLNNVFVEFDITAQNIKGNGIVLHDSCSDVKFLGNLTATNCGYARYTEYAQLSGDKILVDGAITTGSGLQIGGSNLYFYQVSSYDNGQDCISNVAGSKRLDTVLFRRVNLYNSRKHVKYTDQPFNGASHSDGIQIYDGNIRSMIIESGIIGPNLTNGLILGEPGRASVERMFLTATLFTGCTDNMIYAPQTYVHTSENCVLWGDPKWNSIVCNTLEAQATVFAIDKYPKAASVKIQDDCLFTESKNILGASKHEKYSIDIKLDVDLPFEPIANYIKFPRQKDDPKVLLAEIQDRLDRLTQALKYTSIDV